MKGRLLALLTLAVLLLTTAAARADEIDPDLVWEPYTVTQPGEDVPEPAEPDPDRTPGGENEDPAAGERKDENEASGGEVASNAKSLSRPVIALAAGLLALAVAMLIHSIIQNRREIRFEKEHMGR